MITAIVGGLGSGKTATLTTMGIMYTDQDYNVYSNYNIFDPQNNRPFSKLVRSNADLDNIREGYFLGDELWSWVDSRMSSSHANKFVSNILLRSRKRGFNLIYTAQNFHQIDKRIRDITDYIIFPDVYIKHPNTGKDVKIKQNILKPVSLKPFLPFMYVEAFVFNQYSDLPVDKFNFKLEPISKCYDTSEEVEELASTEVKKGIIFETTFKKELENYFPECEITLNPNSGQDQDSFDVEMQKDDYLIIFDCCKPVEKKHQGKTYNYLNLNHKNKKRFVEIEKIRDAVTYFAYELNGNIMIVPAIDVWNIAKNKSTIPISKIEGISIELNRLSISSV